jgi:hypothetical protein
MSGSVNNKNTILSSVKLYIFPSIVTILAMMIWRDVTELRSDVKSLLAQSNIDKTKIEQLEKDVRFLQQSIYGSKKTVKYSDYQHDRYFKHEEFYDVKKNLIKT